MKSKFAWFSILVFGATLLGMPTVNAANVQPVLADLAYQEAMDDNIAELEEIAANRDAVIEELVQMWFMNIPDWETEFRSLLDMANDSKLLAILKAESYAEVQAILGGGKPDFYGADSMADPFDPFDIDKDLLYTPVNPCRIVDTRIAGGQIPSGGSRSFYVYGGGGAMAAQGGNPAGCTSPSGEPRAVHMNIVAVNSAAGGWLTVWPTGTVRPLAGVLNYFPGRTDPVSNAFTVKTGSDPAGRDINVYAHRTTHVVADVMGYYYEVDEDAFKVRFAGSRSNTKPWLATTGGCTNHHNISIFAPGPGKITVNANVALRLRDHTHGTHDQVEVYIGTTDDNCTFGGTASEGYYPGVWRVNSAHQSWDDSDMHNTIPVSRTFTIAIAGTKRYYLNAMRVWGEGQMGIEWASMQATYYPDF